MSTPHVLPELHLLCMEQRFSTAFTEAEQTHFPTLRDHLPNLTIHECALKFLDPSLRIDAVVSPANSYGRLDGAFDDALARVYGPASDYAWITRKAQNVLYDRWRGYAPPGTCTIVPLFGDPGDEQQPWATKYLLLCPTMRVPDDVRWDREVVFECVWSLLCAVGNHNRAVEAGGSGSKIDSILMTPLATGVGRVSAQRWAEQCVLAIKQYVEAEANPQVWRSLGWEKILNDDAEIEGTHEL